MAEKAVKILQEQRHIFYNQFEEFGEAAEALVQNAEKKLPKKTE